MTKEQAIKELEEKMQACIQLGDKSIEKAEECWDKGWKCEHTRKWMVATTHFKTAEAYRYAINVIKLIKEG